LELGSKALTASGGTTTSGPVARAPSSAIKDAELVFVGYGIEAPEYQ
jgi:hypothetical protein